MPYSVSTVILRHPRYFSPLQAASIVESCDNAIMRTTTPRLERITVNSEICHGKPTIRGMRIRVHDVLTLLASGMTAAEITSDYPELDTDDILAVLEYAALDSSSRLRPYAA